MQHCTSFSTQGRCVTVAASVAAAVTVFAGISAAACNAPLQPMQRIELMFGRHIAGRNVAERHGHLGVSDAAWARFLAREIAPRFPDGLTVVDAAGQWRDPSSGRLAREPSKLVIVVTSGGAPVDDKIAAIVTAYEHRFHQKSVGVVTSTVCAAF